MAGSERTLLRPLWPRRMRSMTKPTWEESSGAGITAEQLERIFGGSGAPLAFDCRGMDFVIFARGVMTTLANGEYARIAGSKQPGCLDRRALHSKWVYFSAREKGDKSHMGDMVGEVTPTLDIYRLTCRANGDILGPWHDPRESNWPLAALGRPWRGAGKVLMRPLKGRNNRWRNTSSFVCNALSGLMYHAGSRIPGRCPGLACFAPSGQSQSGRQGG